MARPKMMPPIQASVVHSLFNIKPTAINNCPIAIVNTKKVIWREKYPVIKWEYKGKASREA